MKLLTSILLEVYHFMTFHCKLGLHVLSFYAYVSSSTVRKCPENKLAILRDYISPH